MMKEGPHTPHHALLPDAGLLALLCRHQMSAETWRKRGWRCARCLVRWHLKDSLEKVRQAGSQTDSCRGMRCPCFVLVSCPFSTAPSWKEGRGSSMMTHSLPPSRSLIPSVLLQATATLYRYLSSPPASAPTGDSLMAHESLAFALHDQQQQPPTATTPTTQQPG